MVMLIICYNIRNGLTYCATYKCAFIYKQYFCNLNVGLYVKIKRTFVWFINIRQLWQTNKKKRLKVFFHLF